MVSSSLPDGGKALDSSRLPAPFLSAIVSSFGNRSRRDEPLSGHTTARMGGPADVWLPVNNVNELVAAVNLARHHNVPHFMLGGGANVLINDAGVRGLVIENRANRIQFPGSGAFNETAILTVESGVTLPGLARRCTGRGLSGLEWAVGVPGTIGGAIVNNAGAYGTDMAATLVRAELLAPTGKRVWQSVDWFKYSYRTSRLKQRSFLEGWVKADWIVLQAELQLTWSSIERVEAQVNAFNERRKSSQPPGATMGSMFKNPAGDYAGRLIEAAGLKGHRVGQAQISTVHANFFQNLGEAKASDMLALIDITRKVVKAKFGVTLELEIEVIREHS